jgi:uncharacterized protein (DUF1330 family)
MTPHHKFAMVLIAGSVIGAAAVEGLHAEAKPPAYVVVDIRSITDPNGLQAVIMKTAPQVLSAAGGHYLIRTNEVTSLDGAPPKRFVLIAFDSVEKAQAWHNLPHQKEIDALRAKSTDSISFIVEGMPK